MSVMHLLQAYGRYFMEILNPIKIRTMQFVKTHPAYVVMALLLFLQIPILIAGTDTRQAEAATPAFLATLRPVATPAVTVEELALREADSMYHVLELEATGLSSAAFELAYLGYYKLRDDGVLSKDGLLTIADFSKPSTDERLFVIDMDAQEIRYQTLVAHGRNSGKVFAESFSNKPNSNKSSLGFYLTLDTYVGGNGYSLKLKGLDKGLNDKAYERAIVMHGSAYVSEQFARSNGYLGRSLGCPAVPQKLTKPIINTIKNGSVLFIYHPEANYRQQSTVLNS